MGRWLRDARLAGLDSTELSGGSGPDSTESGGSGPDSTESGVAGGPDRSTDSNLYEWNARNQITLWGPDANVGHTTQEFIQIPVRE